MTTEYTQLIRASMAASDPRGAEHLCRAYLLEHPGDEERLLLLALNLQQQGRHAEAAAEYAYLVQLYPNSSLHLCNYATALCATGSKVEAEAAYAASIECDPRNIEPKIQLGLLLLDRQEYLAARELLLDAFELDRELPRIRIHAARACNLSQDFQGATDLLKPWRTWLPLHDDALQLVLAQQLNLLSDTPESAALLEDLVGRNPSRSEYWMLLASLYERLNRVEDAEAVLQSVAHTAAATTSTEELRNEFDHLKATLALRSGDAVAARTLLQGCGPRNAHDYAHYFDLARAHDKLGETDMVMQSLQTAHALQTAELKHASPEHFEPDALALPATIPRISAESYARWAPLIAPDSRNSPVFIVGFPRSGTTLLEQMLDAHPGLQSMDENPFFNQLADKLRNHHAGILSNLDLLRQYDCDELRKRYLIMVSETIPRHWHAQLVDKNPLNMMWVPLIHRLFPEAKFILALRHPCDVILSCYMQNFRSSILGAACSTLERLAAAYVQAMECWLDDARMFQPRLLVSRYEDLVQDFSLQTRQIADFLELEDASPLLQFDRHAREKGYIATPSYTQVIEPVNRKGLGRWLRYRREFEAVLPILEPMLKHWGYTADPVP